MKKLVFTLFSALMLTSCGLMGDIAMDSTDMDGVRTVLTTNKHMMGNMDIALGCRINKTDTVAGLLLTSDEKSSHGLFAKGERLRVELADGEVITLKNIYDKEYNKETTVSESERIVDEQVGYDYVYSPYTDNVYITPHYFTAVIPERHTYTSTLSYALYPVTYKQLLSMMNKPAVKVGVESEDGYTAMDKPENFAGIITNIYNRLTGHK